jgi:hypothetical protein
MSPVTLDPVQRFVAYGNGSGVKPADDRMPSRHEAASGRRRPGLEYDA